MYDGKLETAISRAKSGQLKQSDYDYLVKWMKIAGQQGNSAKEVLKYARDHDGLKNVKRDHYSEGRYF